MERLAVRRLLGGGGEFAIVARMGVLQMKSLSEISDYL
jgi:hypothetical protein